MASVRTLARGDYTVRVNDTELALMKAALEAAKHNGDSIGGDIDLESMPPDVAENIRAALSIRTAALDSLTKGLNSVHTPGDPDPDE